MSTVKTGPKPKKPSERKDQFIGVQIDRAMREQIEKLASVLDVPVSQLAREAIREYLQRKAAA